MIEIGLMPSSTGEPGGKIVGQNMSDYILEDGKFYLACNKLLSQENYRLNWVDRKALPRLFTPLIVKNKDAIFPENVFHTAVLSIPNVIENKQHDELQIGISLECADPPTYMMESTFSDLMPVGFVVQEEPRKATRYRYVCPGCDIKIYGKPKLKVRCEECDERFVWSSYEP